MIANGAPGNPGTSRARQPHPRPEQSPYFYRWGPQHNQVVRYHHERLMYEPYYGVNQGPMRAEDFHAQPPAMQLQEPVAQVNQLDRSQMYEAQRSPSEWQNYRSSIQTPQAMPAELDSTMLGRTDETANAWNPQMTSQRMEDGSVQLWLVMICFSLHLILFVVFTLNNPRLRGKRHEFRMCSQRWSSRGSRSNVNQMQSLQYETTKKEVLNLAEAVNNDGESTREF